MSKKTTLLLDEETIKQLKLFSKKFLGSENVSGAVKALVRTDTVKELIHGK